uniref:lipocalin-like isoform X2 n=1 Tax=Monopterus albus TaxID=43700 RepID=UPI0009B45730|nr:lipocalin-like isoform X2 [Monopterus albus]
MRTTTLGMLCALMCVLAACAEVTPVTNFNLQRIAGKWYLVGFATNALWFVNQKAGMKVGTAVLVPTDEGNLDLSIANLNADGTCWRMKYIANKTDTPGQFIFHSQNVLYNNYALVHIISTKNGISELLSKLYSRTQETSVALQQRFTQFSLDTGILPENIVILPKNAECPKH